MVSRREFIGGAATLAAGAMIGVGSKIKTYGPFERTVNIFGPVKLNMTLSSDEVLDSFKIRILPPKSDELEAEMKLSEVRKVMAGRTSKFWLRIKNKSEQHDVHDLFVRGVAGDGRFSFLTKDEDLDDAFWLPMDAVERVL